MSVARGLFSLAFSPAWTAGWASAGIALQAMTGNDQRFRSMERTWAAVLAGAWGMEVVAHHRVELATDRPYVFMANHQSHVDIVALFVALPVVPGFLAKKELQRIPFLGRAMEVGGHVFVDRRKRSEAFAALDEAAAQVHAGASIVIFPEGTRGDREEIQSFKKGGFHLAQRAGVPLVPVGVRGTRAILPKHAKLIRPGTVEVHVGTPISPEELAAADLTATMARVRREIAELSGQPEAPRVRG